MLTRITNPKQQSKGFRLRTSIWNIFIVCSFLLMSLPLAGRAQTLPAELIIPGNVNYDQWYYAVIANNVDGSIALPNYDQNSLAFDFERISGSFVRFRFNLNQPNQTFNYTSMTFNYRLKLGEPFESFIVRPRFSSEGSIGSDPVVYSSVPQFGNQTVPLTVNYQPLSGSTLKLIRIIKQPNGEIDARVVDDEVLNNTQTNYSFTHNVVDNAQYYFTTTGINAGNGAIQSGLFRYEKLFTITSNNFGFCENQGILKSELKSRVPFRSRNEDLNTGDIWGDNYIDRDEMFFTGLIGLDNSTFNGILHSKKINFEYSYIDTRDFPGFGFYIAGNLTLVDGRTVPFQIDFSRVQPEPIVIEPVSDPCQKFVRFSTRGPSWLEDSPIMVMWKNMKTDEIFGPSETFIVENTDDGEHGIEIMAFPATNGPICLLNSETLKIAKLGYLPIPSCEERNSISLASRTSNFEEPISGSYTIRRAELTPYTQNGKTYYLVSAGSVLRSNDGGSISIEGLPDNDSENSFYYLEVDVNTELCKNSVFKIFGNQVYLNDEDNGIYPTIFFEGTVFVPTRDVYDVVTVRRHNLKVKPFTKVYFLNDLEGDFPGAFDQNESNVEKNGFNLNFEKNAAKLPGIRADLIFHNSSIDIEYPAVFTSKCQMWNGIVLIGSSFCLHQPPFQVPDFYKDAATNTYATFSNAIKAISTYPDKHFEGYKVKKSNTFSITKTKFYNNMLSIGLYDRYNNEEVTETEGVEPSFPSRDNIIDGKEIIPILNGTGNPRTCMPQITDCYFDSDPKLFLPPYNQKETADENGNTLIRKFISEVGIISKLPYMEVLNANGEPENFYSKFTSFSFNGNNGGGFWGNTFRNQLFGVITTDANLMIQKGTTATPTNTFINNAIAGFVIEPFLSESKSKGGYYNILNNQLFKISNHYFIGGTGDENPFSFQLNKFPFQAPIIFDEIERTKSHGIISFGRPVGVKNHRFELSENSSQDNTVGFKGNLLSNNLIPDPSLGLGQDDEGIDNTTFKNLETGIVITNKDYPGYTDNERNYRIKIKQNTFEGLTTSIEIQPELFTEPNNSSLPAPYRNSYYMELNCNTFNPSSNGGTGMLINPDVALTDIGVNSTSQGRKLSGNIWPAIAGTDRSVLEFDGIIYYSPNHPASNRGWQKPVNWNPIINNGTSEVTYFGYFNEFIDESMNIVGNNVRLSPRTDRIDELNISTVFLASTQPNTSLPNITTVCNPTLGQELYPLPYLISNGNNPSKRINEIEIGITEERLVTIKVSEPNQEIQWHLHDISGKAIQSGIVKGNASISPYQNLPKGTYFIRATSNSTTKTKILVL